MPPHTFTSVLPVAFLYPGMQDPPKRAGVAVGNWRFAIIPPPGSQGKTAMVSTHTAAAPQVRVTDLSLLNTTGPRQQRQQDAQAIVAQLEAMFSDQEGWIEAWHGQPRPSDPSKIELDKDYAHRWHWYTREERPKLVSLLLTWAARYGNVYISTTLYDRPARPKHGGVPLPSRVLFVDDAPEFAPLPYSMAIETSVGNRQAYYLLSEAVDAATRADLQRRIAYALGADKSGWDIEQLGRAPGTWNTKHGGHHPVTLINVNGPRYSVDALAAQFPPVAATQAAGAIDIDDQELKHWLGNVDACIRRIRLGTLTHQILTGTGGNNRSNTRWAMAGYLRKLWGLPSVEIAAILLTFCDWGHSKEKGSRWLYGDVRRCITGAEEKYPHALITPTRGTQARPAVTLPEVARQPRGRRRTYAADEYLAWLCEHADAGHVMLTQPQIVAAYGASIATIGRLERELRKQGEIRRPRTANKQGSWLELLRPITNTGAPQNAAVDAAENAPETAPDVLSQTSRIKDARTRKEEHTAPSVPPDAQPQAAAFPAAAAAIREAFDAYSGARITRQRIAAYLEANYPGAPWDGELLRRCYGIELDRRQRQRQRATQLAALPSMPQAKLRRLERWCERLLEDGPEGPRGGQYYMARWLAPHVAQELGSDRRCAALERVKPRCGRRPAPVQSWTELDATPLQELTKVDATAPEVDIPLRYASGEVWRAVWHGPDADEPVTVVGLWDASLSPDGRAYYQVRESATGMPADEVELIAPDQVTKSHTLTPAAAHPAQLVIVPQDAVQPVQDGAKTEHIRVERGAPLGAVCSSLPAGSTAPKTMTPAVQVIRLYVPAGGWTAATIAALPGVRSGSMAADDLWIAHNRALAATAVQA